MSLPLDTISWYFSVIVSYSLFKVDSFPPEVEVRAVLECQLLARRMYALRSGYKLGELQNGLRYNHQKQIQ